MRIYIDVDHWEKTEAKGALAILRKKPMATKDPQEMLGKEVRPLTGGFKKYKVEEIINTDPITIRAVLIPWPACVPEKKKYYDIGTAHRTLKYLEKTTGRTMDMYDCNGHWHIIVDKNEPSKAEYIREYMNDLRKSTRAAYHRQ